MSLQTLSTKAKEFKLSKEKIDEIENVRLSFVSKFTLDSIKDLTIDQYALGSDENTFCYWLELRKYYLELAGVILQSLEFIKLKMEITTPDTTKTKSSLPGKN